MLQDYKIYFNDRVVILSGKINKTFEKNDGLFLKSTKKEEIFESISAFENLSEIKTLYILAENTTALFDIIKSNYTIVEAAGGIVKRPDGKMLAIFRREKWDLPKGKVEKGEFYKQTALREVTEECGVSDIEIDKKITETYHTYSENGKKILKRTFWYEIKLNSFETPVVQTSEDITDYKWYDFQELKEIMKNTYESLKDIFLLSVNPDNTDN